MINHNRMTGTKYKPPNLVVRGRCHPPPISDPKYKGWMMRTTEVGTVMPKAVGKPVYINHDYTKPPVGKIKEVYRDKESGSLVVDIALNSDHAGWDAMKKVQSLELGELSIGFDAIGNTKTKERVSDYDPQEISLVNKGAMEDALVFGIQIDDMTAVHAKNKTSVYATTQLHTVQNMSTEETAAPASSSAPTDADYATKYTPDQVARLIKLAEETENRKIQDLRDALEKWVVPVLKSNPEAADPGFGDAMERITSSRDGQIVTRTLANVSGNYLKLEAMYKEEKEAREKFEAELKARKESEVAIKAPEERNLMLSGIGSLFSANVTNSAGEGADSNKRPRMSISEMFNSEAVRVGNDKIRQDLASRAIVRPLSIVR